MGRKLAVAKQKYPPTSLVHEGKQIHIKTKFQPKTYGQELYINSLQECTLTMAIGPAGCGKTWIVTYYALTQLMENAIEKIIVTKPILEAGEEEIGFLPGDVNDKIQPHFQSIIDCFEDHIGPTMTKALIDQERIVFLPIAYARGRNLKNVFVLADECQNLTRKGIKLLLTRIGEGAQMAINGDPDQIDLQRESDSGLQWAYDGLTGIDPTIAAVRFYDSDIQRHPLIRKILGALR